MLPTACFIMVTSPQYGRRTSTVTVSCPSPGGEMGFGALSRLTDDARVPTDVQVWTGTVGTPSGDIRGHPEPLLWTHSRARGIRGALPSAACGRPDPARLDHRSSHPGQLRGLPRRREVRPAQAVRLVARLSGLGS